MTVDDIESFKAMCRPSAIWEGDPARLVKHERLRGETKYPRNIYLLLPVARGIDICRMPKPFQLLF
jgi:hypothetical protein